MSERMIVIKHGSQQRKMTASTYEGCSCRLRKGECIGRRNKRMSSRRRSKRGPAIAVGVEDVVAGDLATLSALDSEEYISLSLRRLPKMHGWRGWLPRSLDLKGLSLIEERNRH
ncbi:hypothetical protein B296_00025600 [Ensete ventricosum]|uniref:Uncharacterized protein n=1 Tax=Ensete ventricosum TaxID=4639 RepID=A0A426YHA7_ENSVE|nr:hypothetical protein B296_00025600 [Ensete ventricosum]